MLRQLDETVDFIRAAVEKSKVDIKPRVGITLGSGFSGFAEQIEVAVALPYQQIPHFPKPTVEGHPGQLVIGRVSGVAVALLQGRVHAYEGYKAADVVFPTRVLGRLGIDTLLLTNAAGGLAPSMQPGDFMIIRDHINLTGQNPLIGPNIDELGTRFPDMSNTYDPVLAGKMQTWFEKSGVRHSLGVYAGVLGPSYETPAEIRYLQTIGAQAVGMSTVAEAIAARHMGLKVAGLSCITNLAAGMTEQRITHDEVKEVGQQVESIVRDLLLTLLPGI